MNHARSIAAVGGGLLAVGAASAQECTLYNNGLADETNAFGNATHDVFGARRTLLDDFEVPPDAVWTIGALRHYHIWDTLPPGSGTGMEIAIRIDAGEQPGDVIIPAVDVTSYTETATGRVMWDREEAESWTTFEPIELPPGRYWFEATVVGPENDFWLAREDPHFEDCWFNYEDLGGLQRLFEPFWDLAWCLSGTTSGCIGDLDGDGLVGLGDVLAVLETWGTNGGPTDVTRDGDVGFDDVLALLATWGPC